MEGIGLCARLVTARLSCVLKGGKACGDVRLDDVSALHMTLSIDTGH